MSAFGGKKIAINKRSAQSESVSRFHLFSLSPHMGIRSSPLVIDNNNNDSKP